MTNRTLSFVAAAIFSMPLVGIESSWALTQGGLSGQVTDSSGNPIAGAQIEISRIDGAFSVQASTDGGGHYEVYALDLGDYEVRVSSKGNPTYRSSARIGSDSTTHFDIQLSAPGSKESTPDTSKLEVNVRSSRTMIEDTSSTSKKLITREKVRSLPLGDQTTLPKLLSTTNPGIVQGNGGQLFVRGNHANIQYQIDGVQLPDSISGTFGESFSPRNIDRMEVITGGLPAEYGQRLSAVMNIITKSGTQTTQGVAELNYGSYQFFSPQLQISGPAGKDVHYFLSANYNTTNRGLDTPAPESATNTTQGSSESIQNHRTGNNEFTKLDWQVSPNDQISVIAFRNNSNIQVPTFPGSLSPGASIFQDGYTDSFGNGPLVYRPPNIDDRQIENDAYVQAVYKHAYGNSGFLQVAPYWKYSHLNFVPDPNGLDLAAATNPNITIGEDNAPVKFGLDRQVTNLGLKVDFSEKLGSAHLIKVGTQLQASRASGVVSLQTVDFSTLPTVNPPIGAPVSDNTDANGYYASVYAQDEVKFSSEWRLNAGLRFDAVQFRFQDGISNENALQPRIGLTFQPAPDWKLHAYYGYLFEPAPLENLRNVYRGATGTIDVYDIKPQRSNYVEAGVEKQFGKNHVLELNAYGRSMKNVLDEAAIFTSGLSQTFNLATGYAYGTELTFRGSLVPNWSYFANYTYGIAKGQGLSGGLFTGEVGSTEDQFLDHVQIHTVNGGFFYERGPWNWSGTGLFGSGLRTGENNSVSLPSHFTCDTSLGYLFKENTLLEKFKLTADLINVFDNRYPIKIANGYSGSAYAVGRTYLLHLSRAF